MGATNTYGEIEAYSAREGFEELCRDLEAFDGCDPYNGTLSTCDLLGATLKAYDPKSPAATPATTKRAYEMAEDELERALGKREARAIDAGVVGYDVVTTKLVKDSKREGAKYADRYLVLLDGEPAPLHRAGFKAAAEAKKYALACAGGSHAVAIERRRALVEGTEDRWHVETTVRRVKRAPAKKAANTEVKEVHKYVYAGWAAC